MKSRKLFLVGMGAFLFLSVACESKFAEKSPDDGTSIGTMSLQDRMSNKRALDKRLNDIEALSVKTKQVSELFRKYQKNPDGSLYTPFDLLADITNELKKGIPEENSGSYEKDAEFKLRIDSLSPACQIVDAKFVATSPASSVAGPDLNVPAEQATISLKTCTTQGQYVETFVFSGHGDKVDSFKIQNDALKEIFPLKAGGDLGKLRDACQFVKDQSGDYRHVSCQNLSIQINHVNTAVLDVLDLNLDSDTRFEASGKIYELGMLRLTTYLKLEKSRPPTIEIQPVDDSTATVSDN